MRATKVFVFATLVISLFFSCSGDEESEKPADPTITSITPTSGVPGTSVSINGTNFGTVPSEVSVQFKGVEAKEINSLSDTKIIAVVPAEAETGSILVKTKSSSTSGPIFTVEEVLPEVTVTKLEPESGELGTTVTITGSNFSTSPEENIIWFNGAVATVTASTLTTISAIVPNNATSGAVSVKVSDDETVTGPMFHVILPPVPSITGIDPKNGTVGTLVTISGENFSDDPDNNNILFNGFSAEVISQTETTITAKIPRGATTGVFELTDITGRTVQSPVFRVDPPINFKIAFLADSDIGSDAKAVLNLIKSEGAQVVVHPGDLNYSEIPIDFENHINEILGADFPYFYSVGNHDDTVWAGPNGYQSLLEARFQRLGITWQGRLGVLSSFSYQGISFVSSAPDEFGISSKEAGDHIRNSFGNTSSIWRFSFWHKNQRLMQIGGKNDEAGWDVYEESRKAGALIATGHEHSYSRTFEMSNFELQTISNTNNTVNLIKDDLTSTTIDEGRSFAFVSGIGGKSLRDAEDGLENNPWWANVYHTGNGAQHGALFGEFNYNGNPNLARFYFKDIDGSVRDEFFVQSNNQ